MLTPLRPAATIFWKMSSHSSRTGSRKVWNSPELVDHYQQQAESRCCHSLADSLEEYALIMYPQSIVVPLDGVSVAIRPAGGVDGAFWDSGRPSEENKAQSEDS